MANREPCRYSQNLLRLERPEYVVLASSPKSALPRQTSSQQPSRDGSESACGAEAQFQTSRPFRAARRRISHSQRNQTAKTIAIPLSAFTNSFCSSHLFLAPMYQGEFG